MKKFNQIDYKWIPINRYSLPKDGEIVMTKIDGDGKGERNVQQLKRQDNLWFVPDGDMYVYYTPTHFAYISHE